MPIVPTSIGQLRQPSSRVRRQPFFHQAGGAKPSNEQLGANPIQRDNVAKLQGLAQKNLDQKIKEVEAYHRARTQDILNKTNENLNKNENSFLNLKKNNAVNGYGKFQEGMEKIIEQSQEELQNPFEKRLFNSKIIPQVLSIKRRTSMHELKEKKAYQIETQKTGLEMLIIDQNSSALEKIKRLEMQSEEYLDAQGILNKETKKKLMMRSFIGSVGTDVEEFIANNQFNAGLNYLKKIRKHKYFNDIAYNKFRAMLDRHRKEDKKQRDFISNQIVNESIMNNALFKSGILSELTKEERIAVQGMANDSLNLITDSILGRSADYKEKKRIAESLSGALSKTIEDGFDWFGLSPNHFYQQLSSKKGRKLLKESNDNLHLLNLMYYRAGERVDGGFMRSKGTPLMEEVMEEISLFKDNYMRNKTRVGMTMEDPIAQKFFNEPSSSELNISPYMYLKSRGIDDDMTMYMYALFEKAQGGDRNAIELFSKYIKLNAVRKTSVPLGL